MDEEFDPDLKPPLQTVDSAPVFQPQKAHIFS